MRRKRAGNPVVPLVARAWETAGTGILGASQGE